MELCWICLTLRVPACEGARAKRMAKLNFTRAMVARWVLRLVSKDKVYMQIV